MITYLIPGQLSAATVKHHPSKANSKSASKIKPVAKPTAISPTPTQTVTTDISAGDSAMTANNSTLAITKYQAAVTTAQNAKLAEPTMRSLAKLGNAYLAANDLPKAIDYLTEAQDVTPKPSPAPTELLAKISTLLSVAYLSHGDFQKADDCATTGLPLYDSLLSAKPATTTLPPAASSSTAQPIDNATLAKLAARLAFNAGNADTALAAYPAASNRLQQALSYVETADQSGTLMEADVFTAMASVDSAQQKWSDSAALDDQAIPIYVKLGSVNGQRTALSDQASSYQALGNIDKAIGTYSSLLTIVQAASDTNAIAHIAPILGLDFLNVKHYTDAKTAYTLASQANTKLGDKAGIAKADLGLGVAYEGLQDYTDAIAAYNAALPQYQAVGDNEDTAGLLLDLGGAYEEVSQTQQAVGAYNLASSLFTKAGDTKSAALANQKAVATVGNMVSGQ